MYRSFFLQLELLIVWDKILSKLARYFFPQHSGFEIRAYTCTCFRIAKHVFLSTLLRSSYDANIIPRYERN